MSNAEREHDRTAVETERHTDRDTHADETVNVETRVDVTETSDCMHEEHVVDADVFEVLYCPICGNQSFVFARFEGVFCAGCGVEVKVQAQNPVTSDRLRAVFEQGRREFHSPDGNDHELDDDGQLIGILEKTTGEWVIERWLTGSTGDGWEPRAPCRYVEENEDGSTVPYRRWNFNADG